MVGDHPADGEWSFFGKWLTIFWMVGDHPWDLGWPSRGWWTTILGLVADHPWQLSLAVCELSLVYVCSTLPYSRFVFKHTHYLVFALYLNNQIILVVSFKNWHPFWIYNQFCTKLGCQSMHKNWSIRLKQYIFQLPCSGSYSLSVGLSWSDRPLTWSQGPKVTLCGPILPKLAK